MNPTSDIQMNVADVRQELVHIESANRDGNWHAMLTAAKQAGDACARIEWFARAARGGPRAVEHVNRTGAHPICDFVANIGAEISPAELKALHDSQKIPGRVTFIPDGSVLSVTRRLSVFALGALFGAGLFLALGTWTGLCASIW